MNRKKKDKTEKTCDLIKKQKANKFTGKMIINFSNGTPSAIEKVISEKFSCELD